MINLIRSELYKLGKSGCFKTMIIIGILTVVGVSGIQLWMRNTLSTQISQGNEVGVAGAAVVDGASNGTVGVTTQATTEDFMEEFDTISGFGNMDDMYNGNFLQILMAIFTTIFITIEFSTGSIKQIASKKYSREAIYLSKLIVCTIGGIIIVFVIGISSFLANSIFFKVGEVPTGFATNFAHFLLASIVVVVAVNGIFQLIAFVCKSNGLAITINLLFMSMGSNLVTLLGAILKKNINRFWINNMSSEIVNVTVVSENYWLYIFILLGIAITTTVAGIVIFKTRDI